MKLVIDVGNSNINLAYYENDLLIISYRVKTQFDKSYDEYYLTIKDILSKPFDDVIISSVVPVMTTLLSSLFRKYYNIESKIIGINLKHNIKAICDDVSSVGADLISDVMGASNIFNEGLIVDLGTASKFLYYKNKTLMGVIISPGVATSLKSLVKSTAMLPNVELIAPKTVLNNSTTSCIQSGVIYGFASLVDGMISKIQKEIKKDDIKIILTGGLSSLIYPYMEKKVDLIDLNLTLNGIYQIFKESC